MAKTDTIVIGSGLAGLTAAIVSAQKGQNVKLLTYGSGTLSLNSGVIDVLGYDQQHKYVASPRQGIQNLPDNHPYRKIGRQAIADSVSFFLKLTEEQGFPYGGDLDSQLPVPTAVGTLKPTCLAPESLNGSHLVDSHKIVIVTVKGLKDFYGNIIEDNLRKVAALKDKTYELIEFDSGLTGGRDITTLDVARYLDTDAGLAALVALLKPVAQNGVSFVLPQILGTKGDTCHKSLKAQLGSAQVVETTCLPPSVNGLRLQNLLKGAFKQLGGEIVEDCRVLRGIMEGAKCVGVVTQAAARKKSYYATKFILATGGFYSGGLAMREFEKPQETIFGFPVYFVPGEENWSNAELFSDKPQGFALTGIMTDENLRPVDGSGQVVADNVYIVGRNLGGYDFCFEHSGNGVALASAYKAGNM